MRTFAGQRTLQCALAAGVLAAGAAVAGGLVTAAAGPAGASITQPAASRPGAMSRGVLAGVSCLPSRWCMAVGSSDSARAKAVAWVWEHGGWRQLDDPPGGGLTGVSCSSRTFCIATGFRGLSAGVLWNGTTWHVMTPAPKHVITAPSCASSHMCAVVNGTGFLGSGAIAETWNGQSWKSWKDTSFCDHQPSACGARDVSCATATTCVIVGFTTTSSAALPKAAVWDGKDWHINNPPRPAKNSVTIPAAVSCTGTFCLTIGDAARPKAYVASYDATTGTWKNVSSSARLPWPAGTCGGACFRYLVLRHQHQVHDLGPGRILHLEWPPVQARTSGISGPRIKAQQGFLRKSVLHGGRSPHRQGCPRTAVRAVERQNLEGPPAGSMRKEPPARKTTCARSRQALRFVTTGRIGEASGFAEDKEGP